MCNRPKINAAPYVDCFPGSFLPVLTGFFSATFLYIFFFILMGRCKPCLALYFGYDSNTRSQSTRTRFL